jgi:hypothetical protein
MKHVFTDLNKIAHLWVHQEQNSARNSGNFYFNGRTIYSYGSHFAIAEIMEGNENVIFMTRKGYSVTTSKHISVVWRAIPDYKTIIHVDNPRHLLKYNEEFWLEVAQFTKMIYNSIEASKAPRIRPKTVIIHKERAERFKNDAINFLSAFGLTVETLENKSRQTYKRNRAGTLISKLWYKKGNLPKAKFEELKTLLTTDFLGNDADTLLIQKQLADKKEEAQKQARAKREKSKQHKLALSKLQEWKEGANVSTYSFNYSISECYLRAKDGRVETSQGADVDYKEAKVLYLALKNGKDVLGKEIGRYTVVENTAEHIKIGCHIIKKSIINEFAISQEW